MKSNTLIYSFIFCLFAIINISCGSDDELDTCSSCPNLECENSKGSLTYDFDNIDDYSTDCVGVSIENETLRFGTANVITGEPTGPETITIFMKDGIAISQLEEKCYEFTNFEEVSGDDNVSDVHVNYSFDNGINFFPETARNAKYVKICFDVLDLQEPGIRIKGKFSGDFWSDYKTGTYEEVHSVNNGTFDIDY